MTDRELMQQALDLLDDINQCSLPPTGIPLPAEIDHVMEALRARLAQPEPLPAKSKGALSHEENKQHNKKILDKFYEENAHLYTAPPQREWQGLTDEEIENCFEMSMFGTCRAIEAKLKAKNA